MYPVDILSNFKLTFERSQAASQNSSATKLKPLIHSFHFTLIFLFGILGMIESIRVQHRYR